MKPRSFLAECCPPGRLVPANAGTTESASTTNPNARLRRENAGPISIFIGLPLIGGHQSVRSSTSLTCSQGPGFDQTDQLTLMCKTTARIAERKKENGPATRGAIFRRTGRSRSVATAHMPNHDLVAAPFADRHVTAGSASIVALTATIAPIVIAIVITTLAVDSVSVTAVRSDAEVQLSKRDFGLGRIPSISGVCRNSPHYARDGGDKWQFSYSNLLLCRWRYGQRKDRVWVRAVTDI